MAPDPSGLLEGLYGMGGAEDWGLSFLLPPLRRRFPLSIGIGEGFFWGFGSRNVLWPPELPRTSQRMTSVYIMFFIYCRPREYNFLLFSLGPPRTRFCSVYSVLILIANRHRV